jgi:hypothetical protein
MKTVKVGCRLPNGIILHLPGDVTKQVRIKGLNGIHRKVLVFDDYAMTEVDADFWETWIQHNKDFAPLKSKALFVAEDRDSLDDMAKEYEKEKVGFEGMSKTSVYGIEPMQR